MMVRSKRGAMSIHSIDMSFSRDEATLGEAMIAHKHTSTDLLTHSRT